jgi:hypothetical protein
VEEGSFTVLTVGRDGQCGGQVGPAMRKHDSGRWNSSTWHFRRGGSELQAGQVAARHRRGGEGGSAAGGGAPSRLWFHEWYATWQLI